MLRWFCAWLLLPCLALVGAEVVSVVGVTAAAIASHHVTVLPDGSLVAIDRPAGGTAWLDGPELASIAAVAALWLGAIGHQIASWRRASGERRQQLKWLMSGAVVAAVGGRADSLPSRSAELGSVRRGVAGMGTSQLRRTQCLRTCYR